MVTPAKDVATTSSMKANKHTIFFDKFVISFFWRVNSEVEFRDASTLLPQKSTCNSKWTGLSDPHLALRSHVRIEPGRLRAEQHASGE